MKKKIFSIILLLTFILSFVESKTYEISISDFIKNIVKKEVSQNNLENIFFVNSSHFQEILDAREEKIPFYIIHHPKSSPFFKIIFNLLKMPKWHHVRFKENILSIQEFREYISTLDLHITHPQIKRDIICINENVLKSYFYNWADFYLKIKKEEKSEFINEVISVARKLSKKFSNNNLYLLIEIVFITAEK